MTRQDLLQEYGDADAFETVAFLETVVSDLTNIHRLSFLVWLFGFAVTVYFYVARELLGSHVTSGLCLSVFSLLLGMAGFLGSHFALGRYTRDLASLTGQPGGWTQEEGWQEEAGPEQGRQQEAGREWGRDE